MERLTHILCLFEALYEKRVTVTVTTENTTDVVQASWIQLALIVHPVGELFHLIEFFCT